MGSYSIGEALQLLLEKSQWKPKVFEVRIREEWEAIVGKTIARYTRSTSLDNRVLTIHTDVAALKQELQLGKDQLITKVNLYFGERVVSEIVVR
jgi:predicted nucleic acid-binding Zn ribbon protein